MKTCKERRGADHVVCYIWGTWIEKNVALKSTWRKRFNIRRRSPLKLFAGLPRIIRSASRSMSSRISLVREVLNTWTVHFTYPRTPILSSLLPMGFANAWYNWIMISGQLRATPLGLVVRFVGEVINEKMGSKNNISISATALLVHTCIRSDARATARVRTWTIEPFFSSHILGIVIFVSAAEILSFLFPRAALHLNLSIVCRSLISWPVTYIKTLSCEDHVYISELELEIHLKVQKCCSSCQFTT